MSHRQYLHNFDVQNPQDCLAAVKLNQRTTIGSELRG
jgi:hypothetical protein